MSRAIMEVIHIAVAVLGLLSVGHSAPVTVCEKLISPLERQGPEQVLGTWTLLGEATSIPGSKLLTKMFVESAWARLTAANESDTVNVFQAQKMFGRCYTLQARMSMKNETLTMVPNLGSVGRILTTSCPDCLVYSSTYSIGQHTHTGVQFMSKRSKVSADELEEFHKQVECLGLPEAAILNQNTDPCPAESPLNIDLTADLKNLGPEFLNFLDKFLGTEGWLEMLFKIMSSN